MATRAKPGYGIKVQRDDGTGTFQLIPECLDVNGGGIAQVIVDATNNDSPGGNPEKIAVGLKELDDITFQMHLLDGDPQQEAVRNDCANGTLRNYRLVYPGNLRRIAGAALVQSVSEAHPMRDKMVCDVVLARTGPWYREANS